LKLLQKVSRSYLYFRGVDRKVLTQRNLHIVFIDLEKHIIKWQRKCHARIWKKCICI